MGKGLIIDIIKSRWLKEKTKDWLKEKKEKIKKPLTLCPEKNGTLWKPLFLSKTKVSDIPPLLNLTEPEMPPTTLKEELSNNLWLIYHSTKILELGEKSN